MKTLAAATLAASLPLLGGCPDSGGGNDAASMDDVADGFDDGLDDGSQCAPRLVGEVSNDHGHALPDISGFEQVPDSIALGDRNSGHTHDIGLNLGSLEQLFDGQTVSFETNTNSLHTHQVRARVDFPCDDFDDDGGPPPGSPGTPIPIPDDDG